MSWSSMGESLLAGPGTYTLVLRLDDVQVAPIEIQVLAE